MKLYLVSLGCARNRVDSEMMLGRLARSGWSTVDDPAEADVIVINTCSFIEPAADESIDTILEMARYKKEGSCRRLIVTGCLPERYREEIAGALPEVDVFLGTGALDRILEAVEEPLALSGCLLPDPDLVRFTEKDGERIRTTPFIAYLKIAEGCSKGCTYCIIPKLRGKHRSRPAEAILAEARTLIESGARELVLVAQETTAYGIDLSPASNFSSLLEALASISEGAWIRFLYGHPESIDERVPRTISRLAGLCSYYDIPVQHASDKVLRRMGRRYRADALYRLFGTLRDLDPEAALRTTAIVGFPGETEKDFEKLLEFVRKIRFDHLGVFTYSDAKDLPSHRLSGKVSKKIARERRDRLMSLQAEISLEKNRGRIGSVVEALVEGATPDGRFTGRTRFQAPEVDGRICIDAAELPIGAFSRVRITGAQAYDLEGKPA